MRRSVLTVAGLIFASLSARAQHVYFTTLIPATCPIVIKGAAQSKEFGFQSLLFHNDSSRTVESVRLKVMLSSPQTQEQVVDSGHVFIMLEPGDWKRQDVFLGKVQALSQMAKSDHLAVARAMISVESVEFADGSRWEGDGPVVFDPVEPARPFPPN